MALLVAVTGSLVLALYYHQSREILFRRIQSQVLSIAATAATQVDGDLLAQIQTRADEQSPAYASIQRGLQVGQGRHSQGRDRLGPYTVKVTNAGHPITKGVTATFEITDELYNYNPDPAATPIEVLAEAVSPKSGKAFPQVFVVKHPKARIVGLTLGHDARAHDLPEYQALLKNAVVWAVAK